MMQLWDKRHGRVVFTSCIRDAAAPDQPYDTSEIFKADKSWHVPALAIGLALFNAVMFVRWWVG